MENLFNRLSISNKLAVVFVLLLMMMGVGGGVGLYNARQISKATEDLYVDSFKRSETLSIVENEFLTVRQEMFLHAIITDKASKSYLEVSIDEHRKRIDRLMYEYKQLGIAEDNVALYNGLIDNLVIYWQVNAVIIDISKKGFRDKAIGVIRLEGNTSFTDSTAAIRKLIKRERDTAYNAYQQSVFFSKVIITVTFLLTIIAIVVAGGFWIALIRAIVRPILAIEDAARKIGQGYLSQRAPVMTGDEIGTLAIEFNKMAAGLENNYASLERNVGERTVELQFANEELIKKKHELELANIGLKEANRMKSQFLANVSHELRTPLNSIIGFSELLEEKAFGELNERQMLYVDFIHTSGEHLLQLINDILDFSKIEAGRVELVYETFSVSEAIGEIHGLIRPLAQKRNISIETKPVPASPMLRADKAKFKQIMLNLLSNAVKFNIDGGKVAIDWRITEETERMEFRRYIIFEVRDTGIGIKDEDKGKLFKEFEQIDSSITREYGGTGLGLVLTKRLVEFHGGSISFESAPGRGTAFFVRMPQGTDDMDTPVMDLLQEGGGAAPYDHGKDNPIVLLAGESAEVNHLLDIYLSGGSYSVSTALDGVDVLAKAAALKPFAVVMGIALPKKDGWAVLKDLKTSPETADIPVIIISSGNNKEYGRPLGAFEYLEKPVNREKLLNCLARLRAAHKAD